MVFYLFFWLICLMVSSLVCDEIHPKWMKHKGTKSARFSRFLYEIQLTVTPTKRMKNSHTLDDFSGVFHPCMSWNSFKVDEIHSKWMKHRGTKSARFSRFLYEIQLTVTPTKRMKFIPWQHNLSYINGWFSDHRGTIYLI